MKLTYTVEYDVTLVDADSKFPGEALSQHVQEKLAEVARSAFVSAICKLDDTHHEFSPVAAMTRWGVTVTPSK